MVGAIRYTFGRAGAGRHTVDPRRGWTLLELLISFSVLSVGVLGYTQAIAKLANISDHTREQAVAVEAARSMVQTLMSTPQAQVFALYNSSSQDDPMGPGSAPGANFAVAGLSPQPLDGDGMAGQISFPTSAAGGALALRENLPDTRFGTPRDLNGDGAIDALDHAGDYRLLPISVVVAWQGANGPRQVRLRTLLADLP